MTFQESQHSRGKEGTQQGGQFVSRGQQGTPTRNQPASDPHSAIAPFHTPEQHRKYAAYVDTAKQESAARKQLKQTSKQAHALLQQAAQAPTAEAKANLLQQTEKAIQQVQVASDAWKEKLDAFVKTQHEYAESFKSAGTPQQKTREV